jgi:hypothetical protein
MTTLNHARAEHPRRVLYAAALLLAGAAALGAGAAQAGWYEDATVRRLGLYEAPRAHAEPRGPITERRFLMDAPSYAGQRPADVRPMHDHAFVPLHTGGIFDYQARARVSLPPSSNVLHGREGSVAVTPRRFDDIPNFALYDDGTTGPGSESLRGGPAIFDRIPALSPGVLGFERR